MREDRVRESHKTPFLCIVYVRYRKRYATDNVDENHAVSLKDIQYPPLRNNYFPLRKAKHHLVRTKNKMKDRLGVSEIQRSRKRGHIAIRGNGTDTVHLRSRRVNRSHAASTDRNGKK